MEKRLYYAQEDPDWDFMYEVIPDWIYIEPVSEEIVILDFGSAIGDENEVEFQGDTEGSGAVFHIVSRLSKKDWDEISEGIKEFYDKH